MFEEERLPLGLGITLPFSLMSHVLRLLSASTSRLLLQRHHASERMVGCEQESVFQSRVQPNLGHRRRSQRHFTQESLRK